MNTSNLKEVNNFDCFDNILNINTASCSNCLFGQNDYVTDLKAFLLLSVKALIHLI